VSEKCLGGVSAACRQRKTALPHSSRASATLPYRLLTRKTRRSPIAEPIAVSGRGDVRGRNLAGSEATQKDQSESERQIGHTEARTVEWRHVTPVRSQRRNGDLPVYALHVSCEKSCVKDGSPVTEPDTLYIGSSPADSHSFCCTSGDCSVGRSSRILASLRWIASAVHSALRCSSSAAAVLLKSGPARRSPSAGANLPLCDVETSADASAESRARAMVAIHEEEG